jgi:hypothetical protein
MEETALSHIINAEGEKIQYAIEHAKKLGAKSEPDMRALIDINDSVTAMLEQITDLQFILLNKLNKALKRLPSCAQKTCQAEPQPDEPCQAGPCQDKPCQDKSCQVNPRQDIACADRPRASKPGKLKLDVAKPMTISEFTVLPGYRWDAAAALFLIAGSRRDPMIKLRSKNGESAILLPMGGRFRIDVSLNARNGSSGPASFEILLTGESGCISSRRYSYGPKTDNISLRDILDWETPADSGAELAVKLHTPKYMNVRGGGIRITSMGPVPANII